MTKHPQGVRTKVITVVIPDGIEEITIRLAKTSTAPSKGPVRIARCRAIKANRQRCMHTTRTSWLTERGLCRCSHQGWELLGRPVVPMAELLVVE